MVKVGDKVKCIMDVSEWEDYAYDKVRVTFPKKDEILTIRDIEMYFEDGVECYLRFEEIINSLDPSDNKEPQFKFELDTFSKVIPAKKFF